ncbi:MAG: ABC transporter substrate-binding protein [Pseudomonadota bacterium]|nr:ABC transporter substrate-binding protein [Pseudomonadota bacterium]
MSNFSLTFACGGYDRMQPLMTGAVEPEGIDLNFLEIQAPREIFDRMVKRREFHASEMSLSEFISQMATGDCPFVGIPVFPSKMFRHGYFIVNPNSGIKTPKDMEGKRVGLPMYTQTASVVCRGFMENDYGVDLSKIHWVIGAVEKAGTHGMPAPPPLLKPVEIEVNNNTEKSLGDLLADGEIDAIIGSRLPVNLGTHPNVVRLFPNYREVEREHFLSTGIHPIMHLVVIRKDVHEAEPWIATSLYKACVEAKNFANRQMRFSGAQHLMLPWLFPDLDEIDELFDGDPWPYGIEANRPSLEAMVKYLHQQHFIAEPMPIEDLFLDV